MIMRFIQGFCMALADSVPGVSGGTIAFLLGFYDKFIGSLKMVKRIEVLPYHAMGKSKYEELGIDYVLKHVEPPTRAQVDNAKAQIIKGIKEIRNGGNNNEGK